MKELSPEQIAAINQYRANDARKARSQTEALDKPKQAGKARQTLGQKLKAGTLTRKDLLRRVG